VSALTARTGNTVLVGSLAKLPLDRIGAEAAADPEPPRLIGPAELARQVAATLPLHDS
jgi:hypothetical protein